MPFKTLYTIIRRKAGYLVLLLVLAWAAFSCKKDTLLTNSGAKLSFSQTQILFDTVFTTTGSTFQYFTIHNTHNQPIKISSVHLVGNYTSPFKVNIDGTAGTSFSDITIPANDSIFAFVTVTIDPTNQNNPVVIEDSLQFTTNGNVQYVYLEAWGQDAYFYKPNVFPASGPAYSVVSCGDVWKSDKPHVIYGYLAVDSGCTLTIEPGTKVYMHNNAVLWIYKDGSLNINGQEGNTVTIQGDRLEPDYATVPGQWGEIWLSPGSKNNNISWAVIKNGTVGIEADTVATWAAPTLHIDHTIIKSMSEIGLLGEGSYIVGDDLLVADCQYYCADFSLGGTYQIVQSTFANYWSYGQRQTPLFLINNWYQDVSGNYQSRPLNKAFFGNCIIYGSLDEELQLDSSHGGSQPFRYFFGNCDLKTKLNTSNLYHYNDTNLVNEDPLFTNYSNDDYTIPKTSPVVGRGNDTIGNHGLLYTQDVAGNTRNFPYDLGAYTSQ